MELVLDNTFDETGPRIIIWLIGPTLLFLDNIQDCVQAVDVPGVDTFIVDRARDVGSVDGRVVGDVLPVLSLQVFIAKVGWGLIPTKMESKLNRNIETSIPEVHIK